MSAYRKNYYVPRFYLRHFSALGGKSIHLFHIPSGRNILNVKLRNQCYRPRFYGNDPVVEKALGEIEDATATVFRNILAKRQLPPSGSQDHYTLMAYTVMQRARTTAAAVTTGEMTDKTFKTAYRNDPRLRDSDLEGLRIGFEDAVPLPLRVSARLLPVTLDLRLHLLINNTRTQFVYK